MFRIKPVLFPPASLKKLVNTSHYLPRSQLILQTCRASSSNATTGNFTFLSQMYQDLSQSSWVMNTQHLLEAVHDYTHLPWWATIVVTTVSLRLAITLPLAAYQVIFYYNNLQMFSRSHYEYWSAAQHLRQTGKPQTRNGRYSQGTQGRD
jgi:inner membrane protein COX18